MKKNKIETMKFEEALEELESIASELSGGRPTLEESLELFERGVSLKEFCAEKLRDAEQKIKILTADDEEYREEEFNV